MKTYAVLAPAHGVVIAALLGGALAVHAGLPDKTLAPNSEDGINKSLEDQIGTGRGSYETSNSSLNLINHDPFRSVRRGRQLFQRKFTRFQGQGPLRGDGVGDITADNHIGAGLGDSCASCHGRPRGSAGFGGDVVTQPDSRDAPHLFGLGLKEMLADEMTQELRSIRESALTSAQRSRRNVSKRLQAKGIDFGQITAQPDGKVNTSRVVGVDPDLRVRPLFHDGRLFSIREFVITAFQNELGMQPVDSDMQSAFEGDRIVTPTGMVLDGSADKLTAPLAKSEDDDPDKDGVTHEIPQSLVDHLEMYLLNYFKPATYRQTSMTRRGESVFNSIGCNQCHVQRLTIDQDRRVADVETRYDDHSDGWNHLFATATPLITESQEETSKFIFKRPTRGRFVVNNFFSDLKRHDLGPKFYERQFDGSLRREFITTPLWGVGSTAPYGHDGRSINLTEAILRHGGEAQSARDNFARTSELNRLSLLEFLNTLILFPPDDTASNLNPGNPSTNNYPQMGHGSIKLPVLFNDPEELE